MSAHPARGARRHDDGERSSLGVGRLLRLTATPVFAAMGLLAGRGCGAADILCSSGRWPPLGGMVTMYWLMAVFHAPHWLELIRDAWRRPSARSAKRTSVEIRGPRVADTGPSKAASQDRTIIDVASDPSGAPGR